MSARPTVPAMRRKGPADVLFSGAAEQPAAEPRHVKVAHYMPPGMVADLDDLRAKLRRQDGVTVDRGALIRAAITMALDQEGELLAQAQREMGT